jgi:signal transduction histidine kinase
VAPVTGWRRTVGDARGFRRIRSVRARATLGAVLVVGVALALGAILFVAVLGSSLADASLRAAESRAEELAQRVENEGLGVLERLDDEFVQVVDEETAAVRAETHDAEGETLPVSEDPVRTVLDGDPVLVVSDDAGEGRMLLVAVPTDDEQEAVGTVTVLLAVAVPLLVALVAVTTWIVVGRALRPVDRMRAEVDAIRGDRLDRRVPEPASGDEIAALAVTMNGMLDRLDDAARAQRRFVSDASHELRSPIATIRQHAELAEAYPDTVETTELAGIVRDEALRLQDLVDALLLLARLDEGAPMRHSAVDVDDLALAEVDRLRSLGKAVDAAGIGPARTQGDPRLLGQVLRNLADNAARHARERIAFGVVEQGGRVVITVEDDGDGVPEGERARIFERFVRLDEARARDGGGSGLGLAIVGGIVAAGDGRISVDASRWGGARFVVDLPAAAS